MTNELVDWVDTVTRHNHIYLEDARKYLDSPEDPNSTAKARDQLSTKSNGTSKMNSSTSKTSSQRKKDFALAKMRREEAERQCEAALRLQQVKNQLALEEIESNRQKVAEARMFEVEMEIEAESTQPSEVASNRDFDVAPEEGRTEEWVNNTSQSVHEPSAQNMGDENDTQVTGDGTVVTQIERQPTSEVVTDFESVLFSPPGSPHQGGSWERLFRKCKRVFYAILGNRKLTEDVLLTTFCLVEQTLNARPLTPVSSDPC